MRLLTFIALFFITHLQAAEQFGGLYALSEDIREVVLKAPGGHPMPNHEFQLTTAQSDQIKALSLLDDSMRIHLESSKEADCNAEAFSLSNQDLTALQKRVDQREFQISAVVFTSDKKFESNALGRFTTDDYINYMGQEYQKGNTKANDIASIDSLTNRYKAANPGNNLESLSLKERESVLNSYAESYLGSKLPAGLLMKEMAFQKMVNHSADWKTTLNQAKDKLSSEQKIQLVSKLGGFFGNRYNYDRRDAGSKAYGEFVNTEELLDSVKNGTPGGICRDIALAQTQFLKELGFKNNYVVAYKSASGRHSTVISTDPVSGKIIKFNYDETTEMKKGSGTEALIQDTSIPDRGLGYRIYDTNGKPVTKVSSELAQMLKSSAGGELDRDFNQRNYNLYKVGFSSAYVDGNLFTGKTSAGETLYGVSLYKNVAANDYLKMSLGASLSKLEGERALVKVDQENLFIRANTELTSPALKLGRTQSSLFAGVDSSLMISNTKENFASGRTVEAKKELDADGELYLGAKGKYTSASEKTSIDSKIYASFYPDWNHVARGDNVVGVLDTIVVKTGVSHAISDDTRALIDTAVVLRNYGTNIVVKANLEDAKNGIRYTAGGAAPLSSDMPTFLPGGERRVFGGVEKVSSRYVFAIEYGRNIDNRSNEVMIKGQIKF